MNRIRVLLADDHELFLEGLVLLLNAQPDFEVIGQAHEALGEGFQPLKT